MPTTTRSCRSHLSGLLILTLLLSPAAVLAQRGGSQLTDEQRLLQVMHTIQSQPLYTWVDTLASERFGGRLTGTAGFEASADWVIVHLTAWGLTPGAGNGSWRQAFPDPYTLVLSDCGVWLDVPLAGGGTIRKAYRFEEEFFPGSTSGSGEVTAEVVYVGYGITAPELGYDDYAGVDVEGRIVVMEPEAPVGTGPDPELFARWRPYSFHQYKLENAVRHGTVSMLYDYHIVNPNNAYAPGFIYSAVSGAVVDDLLAGTGQNHREVVDSIREELRPRSFSTGKTATIRNTTEHHPEGIGHNIIGLIEGSDPAPPIRDVPLLRGRGTGSGRIGLVSGPSRLPAGEDDRTLQHGRGWLRRPDIRRSRGELSGPLFLPGAGQRQVCPPGDEEFLQRQPGAAPAGCRPLHVGGGSLHQLLGLGGTFLLPQHPRRH